jgi:hypothetical protein
MSRIPLKESLFLGFCAVFTLLFRALFRLHLHIPGHAMFFTVFFLFMARASVNRLLAASFTGMLAGMGALVLGIGKAGPMLFAKFILPGLVIDLAALLVPGLFQSTILCLMVAALAGSSKFLDTWVVDWLIGMDKKVMLQHALFEGGTAMLFGLIAGLFVVPVIRKLQSHGVIPGKSVEPV